MEEISAKNHALRVLEVKFRRKLIPLKMRRPPARRSRPALFPNDAESEAEAGQNNGEWRGKGPRSGCSSLPLQFRPIVYPRGLRAAGPAGAAGPQLPYQLAGLSFRA